MVDNCPIVHPRWETIEWMPQNIVDIVSRSGIPSNFFDAWDLVEPRLYRNVFVLYEERATDNKIAVGLQTGLVIYSGGPDDLLVDDPGFCNSDIEKFAACSLAFSKRYPFYTIDQYNHDDYEPRLAQLVSGLESELSSIDPAILEAPRDFSYWLELVDQVEMGDWMSE